MTGKASIEINILHIMILQTATDRTIDWGLHASAAEKAEIIQRVI